LEDRELSQLNSFLAHVNLGDHVVTGQLENYSCAFVSFTTFAFIVVVVPRESNVRACALKFYLFFFVSKGHAHVLSLLRCVFFFFVVLLLLLFRSADLTLLPPILKSAMHHNITPYALKK